MLETFKDEVTRNINGRIKFHLLEEPPATERNMALEELNGSIDGAVRKGFGAVDIAAETVKV